MPVMLMEQMSKLVRVGLCLLAMAIPSWAWANPLQVGIDHSFPPFTYEEGEDNYKGLHVEILTGALERAGLSYEIRGYPWKRIVLLADRGDLDIAVPFRHKPERFEKYNMVGPFTETGSRTFFFGRKDSGIHWEELPDLEAVTIGLIDGFRYPQSIEDAAYLDFYRFNGSTERLALMLRLQRIGLLVSDETVFWDSVRRAGLPGEFETVGKSLDRVMRYAVVPKNKPELAKQLQAAMDDFRMTEEYRRILESYGVAN